MSVSQRVVRTARAKCAHDLFPFQVIERMREQLTAKDGARGELEYMHLDLSSLQSVKEFADNFKRKNLPLHILVNNAAVAFVPFGKGLVCV